MKVAFESQLSRQPLAPDFATLRSFAGVVAAAAFVAAIAALSLKIMVNSPVEHSACLFDVCGGEG